MNPFNKKVLALVLAISPMGLFASNHSMFGGISDAVLLTLMLAIILLLLFVINAIAQSIIGINKGYKKENSKPEGKSAAKAVISLFLLGSGFSASAANEVELPSFIMSGELFWTLCTVIVFLAAIIAYLFHTLKTMIRVQNGAAFEEANDSIFETLNASLTDNVPLSEESNVMLDHDYDGIRELDNNLPPWWKYMFYGTIIFAFVYLIRFHITGSGQLQKAEYLAEMQEAEVEKEAAMADAGEQITEDNVSYLIDEASLAKGAAIFKGNCATCHMESGGGGAGPNLTDEYWIHGGGIVNVFKTIKYGVPAKGMIAWQSQFNAEQMQMVASYVLSLQGSNPGNGIAPQGEIWVPEAPEAPSDSTNTEETTASIEE